MHRDTFFFACSQRTGHMLNQKCIRARSSHNFQSAEAYSMMLSVSSCFRFCPAVADDTVIEGRCSGNALRVNFPAWTLACGRHLRCARPLWFVPVLLSPLAFEPRPFKISLVARSTTQSYSFLAIRFVWTMAYMVYSDASPLGRNTPPTGTRNGLLGTETSKKLPLL